MHIVSMTEKEQTHYFEDFKKILADAQNIAKTAKLRNEDHSLTSDMKNKLRKDMEEYAYKSGIATGNIDPTVITRSQDLTEEQTKNYFSQGLMLSHEKASNTLARNLDAILDTELSEDVLGKSLEQIVGNEELRKAVSSKDKDLVEKYMPIIQLKSLRERYDKGEGLSEDQAKLVTSMAAKGYAEKEMEKFKDYSKDLQDMARSLLTMAVQEGNLAKDKVKKYALEGIDSTLKKSKEKYEELAEKKERTAYDVAKDAIRSLAKTPDKFGLLREILYAVSK